MQLLSRASLPVQAVFYIVSGLNHFWHRPVYVGIMPDHYSQPEKWVELSGVAEILGGVGLAIPATRRVSSVGLSLMLLVFLDVHVFMLRHAERFPNIPKWVLWARLPLQAALIAWALHDGRKRHIAAFERH